MFNCLPKGAKSVAEEGIQPRSAAVYPIAAPFSISCTCHSLVSLTTAAFLVPMSEEWRGGDVLGEKDSEQK